MSPSLIFVDHPHHRMRNVKEFLAGWGIKISNAEKMSRGKSNMVAMGELLAIRKTVKSMSLFLHKRANQARAALGYCESKLTGNEFASWATAQRQRPREIRKYFY